MSFDWIGFAVLMTKNISSHVRQTFKRSNSLLLSSFKSGESDDRSDAIRILSHGLFSIFPLEGQEGSDFALNILINNGSDSMEYSHIRLDEMSFEWFGLASSMIERISSHVRQTFKTSKMFSLL